jgi:6-phosphogluconolactonase
MSNRVKTFDSEVEMSQNAITIIKNELGKKDRVSIGFSGGKTPISFFKLLSLEKSIDWKRVDVFLVDERWDKSGEDTLKKLITTHLLSKVEIPNENLYLIDFYDSIAITRYKYEEKLLTYFGDKIEFDILFLGMGSDGHTASIFEDEECGLGGSVLVNSSPRHPHMRISLSMGIINSSKRKIFLLGPEKQKLLLGKVDTRYPALHVKDPEFLSFNR